MKGAARHAGLRHAPSALRGLAGLAGLIMRAPLAAALAALVLFQAWALWRAPAAWFPETITFRLAPGETVTLGAAELAASRADTAHLQLGRDADGGWRVRNLSGARPATVLHGGADIRLAGVPLAGARAFQAGSAMFTVEQATGTVVAFHHAGHAWRYDGATLYRDGNAQPPCADAPVTARAAALWNQFMPRIATVAAPLAIGGNVHCGNRLGVPALPPGAATVARGGGQLRLAAGPHDDGYTALLVHAPAAVLDARRLEAPLAGAASLAVAGARYAVASLAGDTVTLAPARHVTLSSEPMGPSAAMPVANWQWRQRTPWWQPDTWPTRLAAAALGGAAASWLVMGSLALLARRPAARKAHAVAGRPAHAGTWVAATVPHTGRPPVTVAGPHAGRAYATGYGQEPGPGLVQGPVAASRCGPGNGEPRQAPAATGAPASRWLIPLQWIATAAVLVSGVAAMAAQRGGMPPAAGLSLLLAAAGAALWRLPHARIPAAVGAALVLAMSGLLMQLELGLAAPDLAGLRHYHKTAALLAIGSALAAAWRLWRHPGARGRPGGWSRLARPLHQRGAEWVLAALAGVALAALAAQALWGDETGVFDVQPVELAKLALAALSAHGLALHLAGQRNRNGRWLRLAAPALLFCALLGMALVSVDDYSPLILLALWAGGTALAYAAAARRIVLAAGLASVALLLAAAVGVLRSGGAEGMAGLPQGFYADRFQVWLAPAQHPHTGQQWLQGARAIAAGGWTGADGAFGLRAAGMPDGPAAAIPAVQDDFAPSFFMYRHGLAGALLLWCVQAAMLAGLVRQAAACHRRAGLAQGFRPAWGERLCCFLLCGGAAFVAGHFLLSWGTNLGVFPVMGQPMSFMSAGGSHLLFFLCPLLAVSMDAVQPS